MEKQNRRGDSAFIQQSLSIINLKGNDALDFLHRMSTNNVLDLELKKHRTTILTTEKGRMIDIVDVLRMDNSILLIGSAKNGDALMDWLGRYIIMEDIVVRDCSPDYTVFTLFGEKVRKTVNTLAGKEFSGDDESVVQTIFNGTHATLYSPGLWQGRLFHLLISRDNDQKISPDVSSYLSGVFHPAPSEQFEIFRIESGVPGLGREITPERNPLEIGLQAFISFTKGCYIGQEVISRLETYKKVQKQMVGVIIGQHNPEDNYNGELFVNGTSVGNTTSFCYSESLQSVIALGLLDTSVSSKTAELQCSGRPRITVSFCTLPFV